MACPTVQSIPGHRTSSDRCPWRRGCPPYFRLKRVADHAIEKAGFLTASKAGSRIGKGRSWPSERPPVLGSFVGWRWQAPSARPLWLPGTGPPRRKHCPTGREPRVPPARQLVSLLEVRNRFFPFLRRCQGKPQIEVGLSGMGGIGFGFNRLFKMPDSFVYPVRSGQHDPKVDVGAGKLRIQFQGCLVMGDSLVRSPCPRQGQAEIIVRLGGGRGWGFFFWWFCFLPCPCL